MSRGKAGEAPLRRVWFGCHESGNPAWKKDPERTKRKSRLPCLTLKEFEIEYRKFVGKLAEGIDPQEGPEPEGRAEPQPEMKLEAPDGVEVCPVHPPGRENRLGEPPVTRMPQMVALMTEALAGFLDHPYALFGHSIGALTAFELARRFRRQGLRSPEWLFCSGHPSPHLPHRRPAVSHLPRTEFIQAMREHFELDPALLASEDLMGLVYPPLRTDYELVESYVYREEPPFDFPLSIFGGTRDPETTEGELLAWRRHTTGPFRTRMVEGNHMFINRSRGAVITEVALDLKRLPWW